MKRIFDWIVERNNNVKWITDKTTHKIVVDGLTKEQAFSIANAHNKKLDIALSKQAKEIFKEIFKKEMTLEEFHLNACKISKEFCDEKKVNE